MLNVSKWMEAPDIEHNYTMDGQVVSEEAAKGLGVGKFSTRSSTRNFNHRKFMGFMVRLHIFCDNSKTTQAWLALVPMDIDELKAKVEFKSI